MNIERRCIQKITGSCMGCEVLTKIETARRQTAEELFPGVFKKIQAKECPTDARVQLDKLKKPFRPQPRPVLVPVPVKI